MNRKKQSSPLITALYCRLSLEDGRDNESMSISNQKAMLRTYAEQNGMFNYAFYVDDGYTGRNFDRPGFQRMINDIEAGKIGCVITKDLSRLGRNYIEAGSYIEVYFPRHHVRYIAVNDNVDSAAEPGSRCELLHLGCLPDHCYSPEPGLLWRSYRLQDPSEVYPVEYGQ